MLSSFIWLAFAAQPIICQQIWDTYTTTWDRSKLFTYSAASAINFVDPGDTGDATINIQEGTVYQQMDGFGAALTDSSAQLLNNLKNSNSQAYWDFLGRTFDIADTARSAGFSALRISLGASDFSQSAYTYDDTAGDTSLSQFSVDRAPSYFWTVLNDIKGIQPGIKLYILPWSPPAWMKDSNNIRGGSLKSEHATTYANYLLKSVQGFNAKGFRPYAVSLQNEPGHSDGSYPTATLSSSLAASIGTTLRTLLNNNGFSGVKLLGYDHNWDNLAYPNDVINRAASSFNGIAFHCYGGNVGGQTTFHNAYPNEEIHFTECAGTNGSDWWGDIKWNMDNLIIGAVQNWARSVIFWNLVLDPNGNPKFPGTGSCGGPGCRGVATVNGNSVSYNQEWYVLAHGSRAILPKDAGGPWGKRIGSTVTGGKNWALRANAFVTERTSSTEWKRYSLVVLNWNDNASSSWNPQPVKTIINFKGKAATVTFPVGVSTLWWFAA
ncbi:hypothetical protein FRC02_004617 [Tulasnella sp. 418]|nr:hypothetical protein FRC02_004617 [Tulasnella sp. 418]